MQLEKGRSEASTWICAETELRLIYFGVWDNFGQIIGLKKIEKMPVKRLLAEIRPFGQLQRRCPLLAEIPGDFSPARLLPFEKMGVLGRWVQGETWDWTPFKSAFEKHLQGAFQKTPFGSNFK
ncbi:hypothetical protein DKX38_007019 [Salix brachista]|uniref:Uncharacterized protein n=1 Tax=Salix brachista TaxID=2182728 RepID=A0A5N5MLQ6_9ROSI|nr:hypothetical protein DKX38_007019 [Salix brachista]